jgi:hypothetical protein
LQRENDRLKNGRRWCGVMLLKLERGEGGDLGKRSEWRDYQEGERERERTDIDRSLYRELYYERNVMIDEIEYGCVIFLIIDVDIYVCTRRL